ncbi:MAG: hypothetical protein CSB34_02745 [Desulfobulbus propionicus]|nr:MAG: hypothetical protein CSB34_02745 [Desulfobulbus propionicus]
MPSEKAVRVWRPFFIRIILPSLLAVLLFGGIIFLLIIPSLEHSMMTGKKEMIKELSIAAWSIIAMAQKKEQAGNLPREEAQKQALQYIKFLRYGEEIKDYFWVMDVSPKMLMHPYRDDLLNQNLHDYKDREGQYLFLDFVNIARQHGEGYLQYQWEDKENPSLTGPKLSYVKLFQPWGWIIGTGIYLEDVHQEMDSLTNRLLLVSFAIIVVIAALLYLITRESMRIETERQKNEEDLRQVGEKYRTLVEASTEGVLMMIGEEIVYANKVFEDMSGYTEHTVMAMSFGDFIGLIREEGDSDRPVNLLLGNQMHDQFEALLTHATGSTFHVLINVSPIEINQQQGVIVVIKDISTQKEIDSELGSRREKFEHLTDNISIGVFRTTFEPTEVFVEANPATARIFGCNSPEDLYTSSLGRLLGDTEQYQSFKKQLKKAGKVSDVTFQFTPAPGVVAILSITATLVRNQHGKISYCDGFVEDITQRYHKEQEREGMISELQASVLFQNEPIHKAYAVAVPSCLLDTTTEIAAKFMEQAGSSAIVIKPDEQSAPIGIVTDNDIRERLVATGRKGDTPVSQIMSAPLIGISGDALIFEGIVKMLEKNVDHLLVRDPQGDYFKVISAKNLLKNQQYILSKLIADIDRIEVPEQFSLVRERLPFLIQRLFESSPDARNLTRIISAVAEAAMKKCIALAIKELGKPPCPYSFLALGSVGREEQTLVTDQDNALVYDLGDSDSQSAADYFQALGEKVCNWLDDAGYALCKGDIMAKNPRWCQPITTWKEYFDTWTSAMEPADLLDTKIFFDFRLVHGDTALVSELQEHLARLIIKKPLFLYHLTHNCLHSKPPLNRFKNFVVETRGRHSEHFSIKKAMTPLVDYTRIYALKYGINQTNTFSRLNQLQAVAHLSAKECEELTFVYKYLLELRFKHQIQSLKNGQQPHNYIAPVELTEMEKVLLKEALSQIVGFQTKMSFDFKQM